MDKVPKYVLEITLFLCLLLAVPFVLIPYFTSNFLVIREERAEEESRLRHLEEQGILKEAQRRAELKVYLTGRFDPAERSDFVNVPAEYILGEEKNKTYLRLETYRAYLAMRAAALEDDIDLKLASATRNFYYQKKIWNEKWLAYDTADGLQKFKKILEYSAAPGTSRHHWGTEIDINNANPPYFQTTKGQREYAWLAGNAPLFGFCQIYEEKNSEGENGYNEEKWHWSYLPLSRVYTEEYRDLITDSDIHGFLGDQYVPLFNLHDYVLSINPDCL